MTDRLLVADWEVRGIPDHGEAVCLVRAWHYSKSAPNTSVYRHGIYRAGVVLHGMAHGAAIWLPPTRRAAESVAGEDWSGVLSLSRLVCDPTLPPNAASFLLGRSMRLIDRGRWPVLLTYADTALGHTGAIYKATNWVEIGSVAAGDTWVGRSGEQRGRKRGGRNYSVAEMKALGFSKRPGLPKIKFVHDRRSA